ncbi:ABC transporter substrate-binding protein [Nostoc sp. FACHB-87]|uniref:bifunctional serine/threonine-protein kinase/ABC transporter substrate-binding protein n=1 Tax=Nostocaceae TaxID=1162 RepID=UPI0016825CBA|nr:MULTISPECIES: bifunctional serine/threonine-protein kinase/ABC transporter substrate-binding protein [Nostocaceae]MBD2454231.1 ABC transporter substrate-binding protein [Nostoc sp. FACHB-87]MBD2474178.1 ABC transporter substrate-binding protein [Anabaena sp. FACHB-83]
MKVYCTNPNCRAPENDIPDEFRSAKGKQKFCSNCGMRLVLKTRYLALEQIGSGGFGRTFRAWDSHLEHECLIKQLRLTNISNAPWTPAQLQYIQNSFKKEAQILRKLNHPQIPRLWDSFEISAPNLEESEQSLDSSQTVFYLVQDYIHGNNLRQIKNTQWSEEEVVNFLRQILPVLDYIHSQQPLMLIHRDIKPENIILEQRGVPYLIDFGAVKQAIAGVPAEQSIAISTPGYASPEQRAGLAVSPSSDLYSIAATCVCLLTLKTPESLRIGDMWSWRRYVNVSDQLATILDTMLAAEITYRFQSARQVMMALDNEKISAPTPLPETSFNTQPPPLLISEKPVQIPDQNSSSNPPHNLLTPETSVQQPSKNSSLKPVRLWTKVLMGGFGSVILGLAVWAYFVLKPTSLCIDDPLFSCGEKSLLQPESKPTILGQRNFHQGTAAFKQGEYDLAIQNFSDYLKNDPNKPEVRIYLNNAIAAKNGKFIKVAICVPILQNNGVGIENYLRGVAVVQNEINKQPQNKINGKLLLIQLCNDEQNVDTTHEVAEKIVKDKSILGVIGHYYSLMTWEAGKIYGDAKLGDNRLVSISPTSTALRGTIFNKTEIFNIDKYVFRVSPVDSHFAKALAKYSLQQNRNKVAIFFNHFDPYSESFRQAFKNAISPQGSIVKECDFAEYQINNPIVMTQCLQEASSKQADAIFLPISNDILSREIDKIFASTKDVIILSGTTAYLESISKRKDIFSNLIIAVHWHRNDGNNLSIFEQKSRELWEITDNTDINFATAMTYDATQALVEGLRRSGNNLTRKRLYEELSKPNFVVEGAQTKVRFDQNHDRLVNEQNIQGLVILVSPKDGEFQVIK